MGGNKGKISALVVAASCAAAFTSLTSAPAGAVVAAKSLMPAQLQGAALAAMGSQAGVVNTLIARGGTQFRKMVTRSGTTQGTQFIELGDAGKTGTLNILLAGGVVFLSGNKFGLNSYMQFTATAAKALAGRWLRVGSAATEPQAEQSLFQAASADLTVSTLVSDTGLPGPLRFATPSVIDGEHVTGIATTLTQAGQPSVYAVLYVRASGRPLPVEEVETTKGASAVDTFTNWGKVPVVNTPASALPFSSSWLPANY